MSRRCWDQKGMKRKGVEGCSSDLSASRYQPTFEHLLTWRYKQSLVFVLSHHSSGPVPVCLADRHTILATAPWAPSPRARERSWPEAFPSHSGRCRGSRPEEWSHALLVPWKTQVMLPLFLLKLFLSLFTIHTFKSWSSNWDTFDT